MKRIFLFMLLGSVIADAFAQKTDIKGCVLDAQSQTPMEFANIVLQTTDSVFVSGTTSDVNGNFRITQVAQGDYQVAVSSLGYATQYRAVKRGEASVDRSVHSFNYYNHFYHFL